MLARGYGAANVAMPASPIIVRCGKAGATLYFKPSELKHCEEATGILRDAVEANLEVQMGAC